MKILLLIGAGSFIGGISRYLITQFIQGKTLVTFPFGTMGVNLIGCLLIGIVFGIAEKGNMSPELKIFLATGLLGGFTTFSAFTNDTVALVNAGQYNYAFTYVLITVVIGIIATFLGLLITRLF